jgi:hypothetical protein
MGVVVIYIHKLKNLGGEQSTMGGNPLSHVTHKGEKLSNIAKAYNPSGTTSKDVYDWIKKHLANAVEEAVTIRAKY